MKKLFIICSTLLFSLSFAQIKDISKKEAYNRFKNSNIRKACKISLKEFDIIYLNSLKNENSNVKKISESAIYNSTNDKKLKEIISMQYFRGTIINTNTKVPNCAGCDLIIYNSIKEIKNEYKETL